MRVNRQKKIRLCFTLFSMYTQNRTIAELDAKLTEILQNFGVLLPPELGYPAHFRY